ncbi:MAG: aminotransferase class V-fold PLP-dependent enzyme [Planctomycetia bacterium]|nr:aminotransferase class V-fold PLP-dependent enzyme [Planctomycetia bacterium]
MPVTYLDNAATSFPKPESVYQKLDQFARQTLANPGRTSHKMALTAEQEIHQTRHLLNQLFRGENSDHFVFTLNCTDSLNMAMKGVLKKGDHVITTNLEHNSISRPLEALKDQGLITLTRVTADAEGTVSVEAVRQAFTPQTSLVAMTHASNVLGTIQPVGEVGALVREKNALLLVDAAQTAGVIPIDVREMNIDLLALPGHKALLGPTGTGVLYSGPRVNLHAWREGGTGGDSMSRLQPEEYPFHMEGGTPNVLGLAGLRAGIEFVMEKGLSKIASHENALVEKLIDYLQKRGDCTLYGHLDASRRVGTLSFSHPAFDSPDLAAMLDTSFDIAVRPGMHCSPYIHQSLGTAPHGTVRVSPGIFNTEQDIDRLTEALSQILG